ncbi:RHS repeat protein [Chitinophaga sp. Mgbs1]|uniref:RHS repeat protein n=1 Tax=Chitinophaga solisilvae TaxID=1233460 RepID=A0A433WN43_9BACT|nr:RHS repeat protein [Chitinophaga solisilvae]
MAGFYHLSSRTGPESRITYYEYDPFGRLQRIKDKDGNIFKLYDSQIGQ